MNKHEHHGMSRAAELLPGLGTNREIGKALDKSPGTISDYRSGRRRPAPDVIAAIEARWPQVPAELWDAPPRAGNGAATTPEHHVAAPPADDEDDASEGSLDAPTDDTQRLRRAIARDLDRLEGPDGDRLEPGARATAMKKLADATKSLSTLPGENTELTAEHILRSSVWKEFVATLLDAIELWPVAVWAIRHTLVALAKTYPETAEGRALRKRQIAACRDGDHAREESAANRVPPSPWHHAELLRVQREALAAYPGAHEALRAAVEAWRARFA